jgi:uncharacterized membrane protein HdeD (DUF308 family)
MPKLQIFVLRAIVGAVFGVLITRIFYGKVNIIYATGLGIFLVGMAYVMEYFRNRRSE